MKKNLLLALRLLLWLLPVTVLVSAILADRFFDQKEELAWAKGRLVEGDLNKAAGVYSRLRESLWWSDEATAGEAIVHCLRDQPLSPAVPIPR